MSAVGLVLGSEERREGLRKAGIARAAEFSWERMAEETGEIYRRVTLGGGLGVKSGGGGLRFWVVRNSFKHV